MDNEDFNEIYSITGRELGCLDPPFSHKDSFFHPGIFLADQDRV